MQFNEIETKLINLALNNAAADGEVTNAATMLFRQLRKRSVSAQQFTSNGQSNTGTAANAAYYINLYNIERVTSTNLRDRLTLATKNNEQLQKRIDDLVAQVHAARNSAANSATHRTAKTPANGKYYGGILLTEVEREMFIRIATYFGFEGTQIAVRKICKTNREQGSIQGLIKKGLVEKRYNKGLALTEAGLAHYRQYHQQQSKH
jgi:hypothetical protein